jgi:hypothetical protein
MAKKRDRELHNDAVIIIISSFSSAITYILIEKIFSHLNHPWELLLLAGVFLIIFTSIFFILRLKK